MNKFCSANKMQKSSDRKKENIVIIIQKKTALKD